MEPALRMTPEQVEQIARASGGVCEWCREQVEPSRSRIYWSRDFIDRDLQRSLLILCPDCHCVLHNRRISQPLLVHITGRRPYYTRRAIRRILGVHLPPYLAPDTFDLADLYRDACSGWCLNGSG